MPNLTISPRRISLGSGHFMVTTAEVQPDQKAASFTEWMTCTNKVAGFTGGVLLTYFDSDRNVIGNSGVQQNGLGQAPIIGAAHRTVEWNDSESVPDGVHAFTVAQFHDPEDRLGGALATIGEAFLTFAEATLTVAFEGDLSNPLNQQWCDANPDLCDTIDVVGVIAGLAIDVVLIAMT